MLRKHELRLYHDGCDATAGAGLYGDRLPRMASHGAFHGEVGSKTNGGREDDDKDTTMRSGRMQQECG